MALDVVAIATRFFHVVMCAPSSAIHGHMML
jgi:hypothetical protein